MYRRTSQPPAPLHRSPTSAGSYDIYPAFDIGSGQIHAGYDSLARKLATESVVAIDGVTGVLWNRLRENLDAGLKRLSLTPRWINVSDALHDEKKIDALIEPFMGGDDPLWGTRFTGNIEDFFDGDRLAALQPDDPPVLTIIYGTGAALAAPNARLVWVETPKNEAQFRSRAASVTNLGARSPAPPKQMYKRFYFVDWPTVESHRQHLIEKIDIVLDEQRPDEPAWMTGEALRRGLEQMSQSAFRARPWFEPGPWGGGWMKEHFRELPGDVPNYAWSFELISPENGLAFTSDGALLEVNFGMLMEHSNREVLGIHAERFGREFPIRFDYLDTVDGGNLSVQCHPRPEFIREHFGENFTQDETYYITDCTPGAVVYLGFTEDADTDAFRRELERSSAEGTEVDIERWVNTEPAVKHGLYLIPHGTVHCSGRGNLVLEISATPYIFTFKMYDWLRRDLDGNMRPLNIDRAWQNLYFDRRGERIADEFVSKPQVIDRGDDWRIVHLPTHPDHFYNVYRYEFDTAIEAGTDNTCHVLNLVEGSSVTVETANGRRTRFNYAETFIIPAAADRYRIVNEGGGRAMVVVARVR